MQHQVSEFQHAKPPVFDGVDALLLEEVGFKWLMAGHGWWIDTTRLHSDCAYADKLLELALTSNSPALQACAMRLGQQIARPIDLGEQKVKQSFNPGCNNIGGQDGYISVS